MEIWNSQAGAGPITKSARTQGSSWVPGQASKHEKIDNKLLFPLKFNFSELRLGQISPHQTPIFVGEGSSIYTCLNQYTVSLLRICASRSLTEQTACKY